MFTFGKAYLLAMALMAIMVVTVVACGDSQPQEVPSP